MKVPLFRGVNEGSALTNRGKCVFFSSKVIKIYSGGGVYCSLLFWSMSKDYYTNLRRKNGNITKRKLLSITKRRKSIKSPLEYLSTTTQCTIEQTFTSLSESGTFRQQQQALSKKLFSLDFSPNRASEHCCLKVGKSLRCLTIWRWWYNNAEVEMLCTCMYAVHVRTWENLNSNKLVCLSYKACCVFNQLGLHEERKSWPMRSLKQKSTQCFCFRFLKDINDSQHDTSNDLS